MRCVTLFDVLWVESLLDDLRGAPLRTDHHVVPRLVPEVVAERRRLTLLPWPLHMEVLGVEQNEATLEQKAPGHDTRQKGRKAERQKERKAERQKERKKERKKGIYSPLALSLVSPTKLIMTSPLARQ